MIDDVIIRQKMKGFVYIDIPHLKNGIIGDFIHKDNTYETGFIYHQSKIVQYLIDNNFIIVLNQELHNNYNKFTFQLTLKSLLRIV